MTRLKDQERDMFRCVPRCAHHTNLERAQIEDTLVREWLMLESQICSCAGTDHCTRLVGELAVARHKVRLQMGIQDMRQREAAHGGSMQVAVHVTQRIDQDPFLCIVRSEQIGRVAESCVDE